jgi:uncharacterized Ntn-hydrolase superfamily protein
VVTKGAGAAQSVVEPTGMNRLLIFQELMKGTSPAQILALLEAQDPGHQSRQYGIVDTQERAVGFTGTQAGGFAGHLTGRMGTVTYAIQGNLLTGEPVLTAAEQAIRGNAASDLPTRLMAAMLAAREMGGDGRCSCSPGNPTGCGAPPPQFEKSAHVGYMVTARLGDTDGTCSAQTGCASGDYYMDFNVAFQNAAAPDPVLQLQQQFLAWREDLVGRPDHHRSQMFILSEALPANGSSRTRGFIVGRDLEGTQVMQSGAVVTVDVHPSSTATATIGPVLDRGEGVYLVFLTAGSGPGRVVLDVTIDDGQGPVPLSPRPVLELLGAGG